MKMPALRKRRWTRSVLIPLASLFALGFTKGEIDELNSAIAREGLAWRAGETSMTRLTHEERRRRLTLPSHDHWFSASLEKRAGTLGSPNLIWGAAAALDWRDRWGFNWVTPVRDQGMCGSCWAFAIAANMEILVALRGSAPDTDIDLSEQHLLDCANASLGCESGGMTWALPNDFLKNTGVTSSVCYPYVSGTTASQGRCIPLSEMSQECKEAAVRIDEPIEIHSTMPSWPPWNPPPYEMTSRAMEEVKAYLFERPVGSSMRVYSDLFAYREGIYEPSASATDEGLHAVLIVGYDDDGQYWIVKNSWGTDWGEGGFVRIRYNTSSIGMFAFAYEYLEDEADPSFCDDLPGELILEPGDGQPSALLRIANCGGAALEWSAIIDADWLVLETKGGVPRGSGFEVAEGSVYRLRCSIGLRDDDVSTAALTLLGAHGDGAFIHIDAGACVGAGTDDGDGEDGPSPGDDEDGGAGDGGSFGPGGPADGGDPGTDNGHDDSGTGGYDPGGDESDNGHPAAPEHPDAGGCGCSSGSSGPHPIVLLVISLLGLSSLRRRSRASLSS